MKLRWGNFCSLGLLSFAAALQAQEVRGSNESLIRAPDHVLVWAQKPYVSEHAFEELGFTVRKSQTYPEGISSSTIVFGDWSYLELLHFSDPTKAAGSPQAEAELGFVADGPGANSFAVQVGDVDAASDLLKSREFVVGAVAPDMVDPDGPSGPKALQPASWRDFHFTTSPVSGVEMFFIEYPPEPAASPEDGERFRSRSTHRNTARRLSAVWVLVPDLEAEADTYGRMGFAIGPVVAVDHLNAQARIATLGTGAVILTQSAALPKAFQTPGRSGPRIIGLSFEVSSTTAVRPFLTNPARASQEVKGPMGAALLIPLADVLGLFLEFHEAASIPR